MMEDFVDTYDHVNDTIFYTAQNVPGPGADLDMFQSQLCIKCDCVGYCGVLCTCLSRTGRNYSEDGYLVEEKMAQSSLGVIECSDLCSCKRKCGNRLIQYGPTSGLDIFYHDAKGFSLRTKSPLKKGAFICEYAGEVISLTEAKNRFRNSCNNMNYIFVLKEHSGIEVTETVVDPTCIGNIGRYINHSCQPNAFIVPIRYDSVVPHLAVFANCDISPRQEITFDYSGGELDDFQFGKTLCFCGSSACNKFIPFSPNLL